MNSAIRNLTTTFRRNISPFFMSTRAMSATTPIKAPVERLTVFGAGLMGAGIVQVAAFNGLKVTLADVSEEALANGRSIISKSLSRVARKAHAEDEAAQKSLIEKTFANIETTIDPERAVSGTQLIIEAIIENIAAKKDLFSRLDKAAAKDVIFASNTSSLSITEIAFATSEERHRNWVGVHFFNPVPQMKLVEVIRTDTTADETNEAVLDFCKRLQKCPVSCKDTPGFIVNRLLVPYLLEAIRMVERGEATAEDVDIAMRLGAGYPMGPFELSDFVGLDTLKHISDGWREQRVSTGEISAAAVAPVGLLEQKVREGKLGKKSKEGGFFPNN